MQVVEGQCGNFLPGIAADELTGSNDDEVVLGGARNDVINAGGGNDLVLAGAGDDLVSARDDSVNSVSSLIADDIFDGGADIDTFDLSTLLYPGDPGYTVSLDPTAGYAAGLLIGRDALRNFENLIATRYDDHITGNDVQNRLEGRDGADTLIGLGGSDVLIGGKGDDRLEGGSASDTYVYLEDADTILEAGGSADVIQFDPTSGSVLRANVSFTANSDQDLIITVDRSFSIDINETVTILDFFRDGSRVVESLTFTDGSTFDLTGDIEFEGNWLFGTAGDNQLTGVGSTDTVSYDNSAGSVRIDLDSSNFSPLRAAPRMAALIGDALVVGYASGTDIGNDTLIGIENAIGGLGSDVIIGSRYSNVLDGEGGRDVLIGEGGRDFLLGGAGADDFVYLSAADSRRGSRRDVIEDFQRRADDIDLSALDASLDRAGNQAFKWIGSKAFTGKAGELHYVKKAGFILVEGDIDGNGKADFQIQLDDIAAIGKGDFIL
jgi:Ca2+-binding RTX toxin-like protein